VLEFDAGLFGCEVPIGFGVVAVTVALPRRDFRNESLVIWDAAIEALRARTPSSDSARSSQLPCFGV
jgi:hypothetical protein